MGLDIAGWVEIHQYSGWRGVIRIGQLISRNYDAFGCLFGVGHVDAFEPIAPQRGLPPGLSREAIVEIADGRLVDSSETRDPYQLLQRDSDHYPSWMDYREIARIDWQARTKQASLELFRYSQVDTDLMVISRAYKDPAMSVEDRALVRSLMERIDELEEGDSWAIGDARLVAEYPRRKHSLDLEWLVLFKMMEALSLIYGEHGTRLVVWFDF